MKTIYKCEINDRIEKLLLPIGAKILSIQVQKTQIYLWVEIDTSVDTEQRVFLIFGTGHDINYKDDEISYISTVQYGLFVWYIYEYIGDLTTASF